MNPNAEVDIYQEFTKTYKKYHDNKIKRELACLKIQFSAQIRNIGDEDLVAGRLVMPAIGFTPQSDSNSFAYFIDLPKIDKLYNDPQTTEQSRCILNQLKDFWEEENSSFKTRKRYSKTMQKILPSDNWNGESGIAFPLYRMSGSFLDVKKLVKLGLPGLKDKIEKKKRLKPESYELYDGMIGMLDLVSDVCIEYAQMAYRQLKFVGEKREKELHRLIHTLENISIKKPANLYEAVQLGFVYNMLSGAFNFGRYDDAFGEFYQNDIKQRNISQQESIELMKSVFKIIDFRNNVYDSRVVVGGRGRENEDAANEFALVLMEAQHQLKTVVPQFTLRFYEGQDSRLWSKAMDMIGDGCTFPLLYNDDVNIQAVQNAFKLPEEEAIHYMPFGCGEYVINHRSVGTPSGVINLLQALLVTLHNGEDPTTGKRMGMPMEKESQFYSFDDLWSAYTKQVEYHIGQLAIQEELEYKVAGEISPFLMLSILFDDCIERGKAIFEGGIRYLGGTIETYGNTNTADSLTAIKKIVFEEKKLELNELISILDKNFEGYTKELNSLKTIPKYGNDLDEADNMLVNVNDHVCRFARSQSLNSGLHSYLVVNINNEANTVLGRYTAASPDGRLAFTFMANANTPSGGNDKNGVTAMMNSVLKPDLNIHAGMVQNIKFSKGLFKDKRPIIDSVIRTYFKKGGAQAMITVLGKDDLKQALQKPQEYSNLIVRVGGYSAKFVELPSDIQQEIISRTLH